LGSKQTEISSDFLKKFKKIYFFPKLKQTHPYCSTHF